MRRLFLSFVLSTLAAAAPAQMLPAQFDHDRIHLVVHAPDGAPFKAYVDSGGLDNVVAPAVVRRLKLASAGRTDVDDIHEELVAYPAFLARAGVPAPLDDPLFHGRLVLQRAPVADSDLFLGGPWLAGRIWQIDYVRHELYLDAQWRPSARDHALPMGFKTDDAGRRIVQLPRIVVTVDGQPLDMLLDTGAMAQLTADSAPAFGVAPGTVVGAGFIMTSVFDRWRARHPDWRVIERGELIQGMTVPMIEVPKVTLAGFTVGPVWFIRRGDANFTQGMSLAMDKPIVGAFGGSGLHWFHLVLDYPHAVAWIRPAS
ncbi:MAG: hypothetical protein JF586_03675 [Burkholderiales bacterium]|jgi:hypothetical protein|nr:hypothetical protein [Burkholderiales bacterium]